MKIAFTGAHSTGKTTLIDMVVHANKDRQIIAITNIARGVIARGFRLGKQAHIPGYVNYIRDQLKAEREALNQSFNVLLSDRTVLDAVAYSMINKQLLRSDVPDYFIEMLSEIWLLESQFYDLYVYCPIEFPIVQDGVRDNDEKYRAAVSNQIGSLLKERSINYIAISGSPEVRLQTLQQYLQGE